jgi:hypothetical protein
MEGEGRRETVCVVILREELGALYGPCAAVDGEGAV